MSVLYRVYFTNCVLSGRSDTMALWVDRGWLWPLEVSDLVHKVDPSFSKCFGPAVWL